MQNVNSEQEYTTKYFVYIYTNAETLTNKIPKLKAYVDHHNPWIIAVAGVIPKNYTLPVQKVELNISNNYHIFSESILQRKRYNYPSTQKSTGTRFHLKRNEESLWCEVELLISCIYRSESGTSDNNKMLNNLLKEANHKKYTHLVIMSDFNYKDIMWDKIGIHLVQVRVAKSSHL